MKEVIAKVAASLGYRQLKKEQEHSVLQLISGKDVFVCLPTGYGKSLCYTLLPYVFDHLHSADKRSIVLVVSPLSALMKDQVAAITALGITATYITDMHSTAPSTMKVIQDGGFQIVLISPEALFCGGGCCALTSTGTIW